MDDMTQVDKNYGLLGGWLTVNLILTGRGWEMGGSSTWSRERLAIGRR